MHIEDKSPPSRLVLVTLGAAHEAICRAAWRAFAVGLVAGVVLVFGLALIVRVGYVAWLATGQ